jgi:hypothetical protein
MCLVFFINSNYFTLFGVIMNGKKIRYLKKYTMLLQSCLVMGEEQHIGYVVMYGYGRRPSHCNAHI